MRKMTIDWGEHCCFFDGGSISWSEPRLDSKKGRYRSFLHGKFDDNTEFKKEVTIAESDYSEDGFRYRLHCEVVRAILNHNDGEMVSDSLNNYLFSGGKWDEIRSFFGWSLNTAATYRNTLCSVFGTVLMKGKDEIRTADIDDAINDKCAHRKYKASTIRSWYKMINRVYIYLAIAYPGLRNPVRMNGKRLVEAFVDQKHAAAIRRISQTSLAEDHSRAILWAFLQDIKEGDYRGVLGVVMLESGRRPIEAGATTLGMHCQPPGERFLSAQVYEVDNETIVNEHKTCRSNRLVPDSPVLAAVYRYYYQEVKKAIETADGDISMNEVPLGGRFMLKEGRLQRIVPLNAKTISAYVRQKLVECGITLRVAVDASEEDTDDNRRAYILRYTAATDLFAFLPRDIYQYVLAHRRSIRAKDREDNDDNPGYYLSPQIQREIYLGMEKRDEVIYGENIVAEIEAFLGLDKSADSDN